MSLSLFVTFVLLVVNANSQILISECGILDTPFATYKLANDIVVRNKNYGYACLDITADGIALDGNGFELSSASTMLHAVGVQYSGVGTVVANMRISNIRTGIHAKGEYGEVFNNTITRAINGIDVSATHNIIQRNVIGQFEAYESTAGIYVYFPAIVPIDSYINITNNVISDIQGDTWALGISVYYATSVFIAQNTIFNLRGGISSQEIAVIHGKVDATDNSFSSPAGGSYTQAVTVLASLFTVILSFVFYRSSSLSVSPTTPKDLSLPEKEVDESEKETEEELEKERQREEYEMDGADVVVKPKMSISLGSSPTVR